MAYIALMRPLVAVLLFAATPAVAGWEVATYRDKMTDRMETFATVTVPNGAKIYVGCKNGAVFPEVTFPRRPGWGRLGVSYRFDSGEVTPRMVPLSQDGTELYLWMDAPGAALTKLRQSKRVRVQLGSDVMDFDTTGAAEALARVKCR